MDIDIKGRGLEIKPSDYMNTSSTHKYKLFLDNDTSRSLCFVLVAIMEVFSVSRLLPLPTYWNSPLRLIDYDAVDSNLDFSSPEFAAMYLQFAVPRKDETTEAISYQPESPAGSMRSRK